VTIKVAHVIHSGGFYGAERVVLDLMDQQRHRPGLQSLLIDIVDPGVDSSELGKRANELGCIVERLTLPRGLGFSSVRCFAECVSRARASLVHSHGYKPTMLHRAARFIGHSMPPLLVTAHGYNLTKPSRKDELYRLLDLFNLKRADAVVSVSGAMCRYLSERGIESATIRNGITTDLKLTTPPAEPIAGSNVPTIIAVGRLIPMKNFAALIDAVAEVRKDIPCQLVILGDGPLRAELEDRWTVSLPDLPLRMISHTPRVLEWIAAADLLCIPSGPGEGLPMVALEAGALGKPIVATNSGGIGELIDENSGVLVPMGDQAALVNGLRTVLTNKPLRDRIGSSLRDRVRERHDRRFVEQQYFSLYATTSRRLP
jgi:glycosyltransferase involved in cell wall biosynthesis